VNARILTAKSAPALEQLLRSTDGDVAHIGYAIDSKTGLHHALVVFHDETTAQRGTVSGAADRFIHEALDAGTPRSKEV
jgi:hypothetical protein